MRLIVTALGALMLVGCAGQEQAQPVSATELLADAAANVRERGTFTFEFDYVRTRADRLDKPERYARGQGAVDLATRRGRMSLELDLGLPSGTGSDLEEELELRWDGNWLEAEVGGESRRLPHDRAREMGGLLGRLPDEPEAMIALLEPVGTHGGPARSPLAGSASR